MRGPTAGRWASSSTNACPAVGRSKGTVAHVLYRLIRDGITPIDQVVPDLPEDVSRLITALLSTERDGRPPMAEVRQVLERYVEADAERR